jgi:hypothetical protein
MPRPDEFERAALRWMVFEDVVMSHDELIAETRDSVSRPSLHAASDACIFSPSTRWRFLRPFVTVSRTEES